MMIKNNIILHIPHSSTFIPDYTYYDVDYLKQEIELLTDHATDKIFYSNFANLLITPFSRVFCDVERFANDEDEPMSKFGRGFYYTKTDDGNFLRDETASYKNHVFENYYKAHHDKLNELVSDSLNNFDNAIIIDCHSFSDTPFETDLIKEENRPDICIGTDNFHTPQKLIDEVLKFYTNVGYSIEINNPYSGTIVNSESYQKDENVYSIMIEINRKLYMTNNIVDYDKVQKLNAEFNKLLEYLNCNF